MHFFLIQYGAKVLDADFYGNTYLHRAVEAGEIDLVRALYQRGADPHAENKPLKRTPLSIAQQEMKKNIVQILLQPQEKKP